MDRSPARRIAPLASIIALLGLGLVACGDDDDAADTSAAGTTAEVGGSATTMAGSVAEPATTTAGSVAEPLDIDRDEYVATLAASFEIGDQGVATCVAGSVVDGVGFEDIQTAGVTPEEFAEASSLADVNLSVDDEQTEEMRSSIAGCDNLVVAVLENAEFSDTERTCVEDLFTADLAAELLVAELSGAVPSPELQAVAVELEACSDD